MRNKKANFSPYKQGLSLFWCYVLILFFYAESEGDAMNGDGGDDGRTGRGNISGVGVR